MATSEFVPNLLYKEIITRQFNQVSTLQECKPKQFERGKYESQGRYSW